MRLAESDHPSSPDPILLGGAALTLGAFALRLHGLEHASFWLDELFTVWVVQDGLAGMLSEPHHPPLVFLMTALTQENLGQGEFAARIPSLFSATLAIPLLIRLGKTTRQARAGLWAAFLLALSPLHLAHAQEARHYALLATLSLASFLLLYRALQRPTARRWLLFAAVTITNLYTHYGAFVVLAAQSFLVLAWAVRHKSARRWSWWLYPTGAGALVALAYLPWMGRWLAALQRNTEASPTLGTGEAAPLSDWLGEIFYAFGMYYGRLPHLLLALCLLGLALWAWRRQWNLLLLALAGFALPTLFVAYSPVARGAYARYLIYGLPFYLFAVGAALSGAQRLLHRLGPWAARGGTAFLFVGLLLWSVPGVQREYENEATDWRGIRAYLQEHAAEGDVLLLMGANYASGFNTVATALPFYLDGGGPGIEQSQSGDYHVLQANRLQIDELESLPTESTVWTVLYNWRNPASFAGTAFEAEPFQQWLHVLRSKEQSLPALQQLAAVYEQTIPLAPAPAPQCLLQRDLAAVYVADARLDHARQALSDAKAQCAELPDPSFETLWQQTEQELEGRLLLAALGDGQREEALAHANRLLQFNRKHPRALDTVTAVDLLARFREGKATVAAQQSPEPVEVRDFTMPDTGDWGEVLFMHPPAAVTFDLQLPPQPVAFTTRLALDPQSWEWAGDGVTFVLVSETDGQKQELLRKHVSLQENDRRWHDISIPLNTYRGQHITLTLATENGPAGNGTGDWAGWETPRLRWMTRQQ